MNRKWVVTFVLTACALPGLCQLNNKVEVAVARAQAHRTMASEVDLDPQILTQAEARLQKDRDVHSGYAKHNLLYYYNQILAEQNQTKVGQKETQVSFYALEENDPYILTRAEELLQKDRNAHSGYPVHNLSYYYQQVKQEEETSTPKVAIRSQAPRYYVPLVQLKEEDNTPGADGPETAITWVEIGGEYTADGYEPEYFYLTSKTVVIETKDGPKGPFYEPIVPAIFNEAYKRFAADPRCAKATVSQTRQLLTQYYRQVQAEKQRTHPAGR